MLTEAQNSYQTDTQERYVGIFRSPSLKISSWLLCACIKDAYLPSVFIGVGWFQSSYVEMEEELSVFISALETRGVHVTMQKVTLIQRAWCPFNLGLRHNNQGGGMCSD